MNWRWLIVIASGLGLILTRRLLSWHEPLLPYVLLYMVAPLLLAAVLGFKRQDLGLQAPEDRRGWLIVGAMLVGAVVFAIVGTLFTDMMEFYPVEHWGSLEPTLASMLPYEAAMGVILLATEMLYRGWLVLATAERLGRWSIVVSAIPYALAHIAKPPEEVVFSLFAGLAFGLADLETRSIVPSFAAHMVGSAMFDAMAVGA